MTDLANKVKSLSTKQTDNRRWLNGPKLLWILAPAAALVIIVFLALPHYQEMQKLSGIAALNAVARRRHGDQAALWARRDDLSDRAVAIEANLLLDGREAGQHFAAG